MHNNSKASAKTNFKILSRCQLSWKEKKIYLLFDDSAIVCFNKVFVVLFFILRVFCLTDIVSLQNLSKYYTTNDCWVPVCLFCLLILLLMYLITMLEVNGILLPKLFWPTARKNVLVIKKNFWNSRLKAKNWQNFWDRYNNLFKQWKVRTIFGSRMLF